MPQSQSQLSSQSVASALPRSSDKLRYNELLDAQGQFRPHWEKVLPYLRAEGFENLDDIWQQAERMLRDSGVAYHIYNDPQGTLRPWMLDGVPLCIAAKEWQHIEASLMQRARLLNALLEDFYGPQKLLEGGWFPPSLVLGHPDYLRPCHGVAVPKKVRLHLYAADLARSPDGTWWVLWDRTQAPSGTGYALENRIVMSRVLPDAFRDGKIERLASFFRTTQNMLASLAKQTDSTPRIVLLTPGPYNETYFEHAYLARYLGYALVEGSDLTVRDQKVYLKTLNGLRQVDVILRRVDDNYCDPLELRDDSLLGIPGLVEAVRSGQVVVANSLGSSLVQTPALTGYLPGLCRQVLGEELLMPSVATWWCGEEKALSYVAENLDHLVIRHTFPSAHGLPIFGNTLSPSEKKALLDQIAADPSNYVAQEQVRLSEAPTYLGERLESRSILMRVFVSADEQGGYAVMPGALTRVASSESSHTVSMQLGGGSKDTWVETETYREHVSLLPQQGHVPLRRASYDLPSRVADNLFWLGRYAERSESTARIYRAIISRLTQEQGRYEMDAILPALQTLALHGQFNLLPNPDITRETVVNALPTNLFDIKHPGSLRSTVYKLHSIAAIVRDRISTDTWRILNQLYEDLEFNTGSHNDPQQLADQLLILNNVILSLSAFNGMTNENMTQSHGWRFLELGRRFERCLYSTRLILESLQPSVHARSSRLDLLLEIFDCTITYRQKYFSLQLDAVLDLVLSDQENPRSLASQIQHIYNSLQELPQQNTKTQDLAEEKLILRCLSQIQLMDYSGLDAQNNYVELMRQLNRIALALAECSSLLALRYFSHLRPSSAGQGESLQREEAGV